MQPASTVSTDPCPPSLGAQGSLRCLVCQENSSAPVPALLGQCLASHSFQHGEAAQRWGAGGSSALECALSCISPPKALRHRCVPVSELVSDTATLRLLTESSKAPLFGLKALFPTGTQYFPLVLV